MMLFVWLGLTVGCANETAPPTAPKMQTVTIDGRRFDLELALTEKQRHAGLSGRESIPADGGMLFVFPDVQRRTFVMRKCLVPIDIIFLGPNGRVVAMHKMQVEEIDWERDYWSERDLTPYPSHWPAQFAIELQGGMLEELNISLGDPIELPIETLKRWAQ